MPFIDPILFNNRSFSVIISRYRTTYRNCLRMATDRPDCLGQRDTSRFPLKKVLPQAPGKCSLLAGGASREASSHIRTWRSPAQERGEGNDSGSCAIKVDLDSLRKCSASLPEGTSPISGGPGGHSWTTVVRRPSWLSANTPQRALSVPLPLPHTAAFKLRDRSCANSPELALWRFSHNSPEGNKEL